MDQKYLTDSESLSLNIEATCLLPSSPRNFPFEIKMDKYRPCPSMISMFTSDSQHPPRSRHAVHLGVYVLLNRTLAEYIRITWKIRIATKQFCSDIQNGCYGRHLKNIQATLHPECISKRTTWWDAYGKNFLLPISKINAIAALLKISNGNFCMTTSWNESELSERLKGNMKIRNS